MLVNFMEYRQYTVCIESFFFQQKGMAKYNYTFHELQIYKKNIYRFDVGD